MTFQKQLDMTLRIFATGLMGMALTACSPALSVKPRELKPSTQWVAESEEWAREASAVFTRAEAEIRKTADQRAVVSWAVVMDLDETVLNNVQYQIERDTAGLSYTPESWFEWTQRQAATLVPGAARFINAVIDAGGLVAFVTNRKAGEQLATENNLAALGLNRNKQFHVLLTRATPRGDRAKDARFALVPQLLAVQGYPNVDIVAYVGDNVGDQPAEPGNAAFYCIDQGAMYGEPCAAVPGPGQ